MTGDGMFQSKALLTLIMTRAQIVGMMADSRLGPLAKQVGCLLWAITETWSEGEAKRVPWGQVAERIVYPEGRTPSERGVRNAVAELESAGYVVVDRSACGRGRPAVTRMVRRSVGDPLLSDGVGSDWRVWTGDQVRREGVAPPLFEDAILHDSGVFGGPVKGASVKGASDRPPLPVKGVSDRPPLAVKGVSEKPPNKETSYKVILQEDSPPLIAAPSAAALADTRVSCQSADGLDATQWATLTSPRNVTSFLQSVLPREGKQEMGGRKVHEIQTGIHQLMTTNVTVPEIILGLGYWAADRNLAQANILSEVILERLGRLDYDRTEIGSVAPRRLFGVGWEFGESAKRERSARRARKRQP